LRPTFYQGWPQGILNILNRLIRLTILKTNTPKVVANLFPDFSGKKVGHNGFNNAKTY